MLWRDGYIIKSILFVFGSISLFVAWAAFVPLSEGVAAGGTVVVESDRQVVQHLEGGIIKDILVDNGDIVDAGDPLIVLTSSATESAHKQLVFEAATLNVSIVRAEALANGKAVLALPDLQDFDLESEERERILAQQSDLFRDQRQSLKADLELLKERQSGALKSAGLKQAEKETIRGSIEVVKSELQLAEDLLAQQMGRVDRVRSLEKELANLLSNEARLESELVGAENEARDFAGQIEQVKSKFKQDLAAALIEYRRELEAVNSNLSAAEDSLKRFVLHAPRDGEVFNLRFKTVGGVVRPGEEILEIVPADTGLRALLRIKPSDRSAGSRRPRSSDNDLSLSRLASATDCGRGN